MKKSSKIILDPTKIHQHLDENNKVLCCYFPSISSSVTNSFIQQLERIPFTRVNYISQYGKRNRTPRQTWAYGKVNQDIVTYTKRGSRLNFKAEPMPPFLQELGDYCRKISIHNWGFDPAYNSCIIGKYEDRNDSISFHSDREFFLAHHFCANVSIGCPRDFQFRINQPGDRQTYEIKLADKSLFFFKGLEHSLPKRAAVKKGDVRYSISFRNMNKDIGIANSYYYCRGIDGAVDDEDKNNYIERLNLL